MPDGPFTHQLAGLDDAAETLAPACHDEHAALDQFFAHWDEDDLDLLAAPE